MKGCPLRCDWCDNPESQYVLPEIMLDRSKCAKCGGCLKVCPNGASIEVEDGITIDREACAACGVCVSICAGGARQIAGGYMTIDELMQETKKDELFYRNSNGGVTLSGGEPLSQAKAARNLLKRLREEGYHTALDTCGYARRKDWEGLLDYVDLVLFDIKLMDPRKHKAYTGGSNRVILSNLEIVVTKGVPTWVRVPIIPGYNDGEENTREMMRFILRLDAAKPGAIVSVNLLPYHALGSVKYEKLQKEYKLKHIAMPTRERVAEIKGWCESEIRGRIPCSIGG